MNWKLSERESERESRPDETPLIDWHRVASVCWTPVRKLSRIQTPKPLKQALLSVPKPVRWALFRPLLVVAVAFHYWLLTLPSPSDRATEAPTVEETEETLEEEAVRITQLQTTQPETPPPESPPTESPAIAPPPDPDPTTADTLPSLQPSPTPTPTAAPTTTPTPNPTSTFEETPNPTPTPVTKTTPEPTPSPTPDPGRGTTVEDPFNDFPFPPNAAVGSLGLLSDASDAEARNVSSDIDGVYQFYAGALPDRQITIAPPVKNEPNFRIFQLSPQAEGIAPQFLHLVFHQNKTVIFRAPQPILELAALQDAESISVEERTFERAIDAAGNDLTLSQFRGVELDVGATQFCCDPSRYTPKGVTVPMFQTSLEQLRATVTSRLQERNFSVRPTQYQGVGAIEAQLGSFTGYVIFAPAYHPPGSPGTQPYAVFTSTTPP